MSHVSLNQFHTSPTFSVFPFLSTHSLILFVFKFVSFLICTNHLSVYFFGMVHSLFHQFIFHLHAFNADPLLVLSHPLLQQSIPTIFNILLYIFTCLVAFYDYKVERSKLICSPIFTSFDFIPCNHMLPITFLAGFAHFKHFPTFSKHSIKVHNFDFLLKFSLFLYIPWFFFLLPLSHTFLIFVILSFKSIVLTVSFYLTFTVNDLESLFTSKKASISKVFIPAVNIFLSQ